MSIQTQSSQLNGELTLRESSESPITIHGVHLTLTQQDTAISECRLAFEVSSELYQRIDSETLFNLRGEVRTPVFGQGFQPGKDIHIEARLDSDLLPQLLARASNAEEAATYLQTLSREESEHPLLSPYSWYALEVKQQQEKGKTGYRTVWFYFQPDDLIQNGIERQKLDAAMLDLTKDLMNASFLETSEDFISQAVKPMTEGFGDSMDEISQMTQKVVSEAIEQMNAAFDRVGETITEVSKQNTSTKNIFETLTDFLTQENWPFQANPETQTLNLSFQGKNGRYECYALARPQEQQMVFYSMLPIPAPENRRSAVAEFLTRANYGIIIGNFELDFSDGEIRYKTSIDVEGDRLTPVLIQHLVYANVTMVDEYLPGIMAVVEGKRSPQEAIDQIENHV